MLTNFNEQKFQFHKGTIKTFENTKQLLDISQNFNSIKVRLKPANARLAQKQNEISIP